MIYSPVLKVLGKFMSKMYLTWIKMKNSPCSSVFFIVHISLLQWNLLYSRGFDIGNHFSEHIHEYSEEFENGVIATQENYPTHEQQVRTFYFFIYFLYLCMSHKLETILSQERANSIIMIWVLFDRSNHRIHCFRSETWNVNSLYQRSPVGVINPFLWRW